MNRFPRVLGVRSGYDPDQVDALIRRIEGTLGRGAPVGEPITADEIRDARFRTKLGGYNETAVDFALEAFIVAVETRAAQQAGAARPPAAESFAGISTGASAVAPAAEPRAGGPWTGEVRVSGAQAAEVPEPQVPHERTAGTPAGPQTGEVRAGGAGTAHARTDGPADAGEREDGSPADTARTDEIWVAGTRDGEAPAAGARAAGPGEAEAGAPGFREAETRPSPIGSPEIRDSAAPAAESGRPRDLWPKPPLPASLAVAGREEQAVRVERVAFRPGRLGMGYDEGEVDVFLDRLVATLRGTTEQPLTPHDVREAKFGTVVFRTGYSVSQVDGFLAEMAEVLERYTTG
ncbi:DivIVA domain-containing protein [Planomonospora sp. ID67723]|uniref:DivIVA domain-containing protein n=1 Tax=Planomonospora sp. ID67723 TaxID=2738134 RepID=UPI0018C3FC89|nr:DivIVA domain-containing protein [Planomonospora sp. ID67723]MBG0828602.1 DivIVA domain-containing protein [Planomonospora sp. ID67723]